MTFYLCLVLACLVGSVFSVLAWVACLRGKNASVVGVGDVLVWVAC